MTTTVGGESHTANHNAGFQSDDNKKHEDASHFVVH